MKKFKKIRKKYNFSIGAIFLLCAFLLISTVSPLITSDYLLLAESSPDTEEFMPDNDDSTSDSETEISEDELSASANEAAAPEDEAEAPEDESGTVVDESGASANGSDENSSGNETSEELSAEGDEDASIEERSAVPNEPGWYNGDEPQVNPFPEVISEADIQTAIANRKLYIIRARVTLPGQDPIICDWQDIPNLNIIGSQVDFCMAVLPMRNVQPNNYYNVIYTFGMMNGYQRRPLVVDESQSGRPLMRLDWTDGAQIGMYLNGQPAVLIPGRTTPDVGFHQLSATQYMELRLSGIGYNTQYFVNMGLRQTSGAVSAITSIWLFNQWYKNSATFHFVDENAYREARGLTQGSAVTQRSDGYPAFSSVAFQPFADLTDLADPSVSRGSLLFGASENDDVKHTLLRPVEEAPAYEHRALNRLGNWYQYENSESRPYIMNELKPSLTELKTRAVPGYVYAGNDIDLPAGLDDFDTSDASLKASGNHYLMMSVGENGNLLQNKHYYVLQRPIPRPYVLLKQDSTSEKFLPGAEFKVQYQAEDGRWTDIPGSYTTDNNGKIEFSDKEWTLAELKEVAKTAEAGPRYYQTENGLLFAPGVNYRLMETKAPEGYEAGEAVTFTPEVLSETDDTAKVEAVDATVVNTPKPATEPTTEPTAAPSTEPSTEPTTETTSSTNPTASLTESGTSGTQPTATTTKPTSAVTAAKKSKLPATGESPLVFYEGLVLLMSSAVLFAVRRYNSKKEN